MEVTVTSKLHTQEYRDTKLNIVVDEIGPGEGRLDSGGIEIPSERRWVLLKIPRGDTDGVGEGK